jgi:predicted ATP-dependent endonuclease of OLD family
MRLRNVYIKNFRALREVTISFSNMTVIIGENDCGKTSVMLALQVFFEAKKLNDESDYFKKDVANPVIIEARFDQLEEVFAEQDLACSKELWIRRTFFFNQTATNEIRRDGNWEKLAETKMKQLLPDFVLVPASRSLESQGKMTTTGLLGKLLRPLIKQILVAEGAVSAGELRKQIRLGVAKRIADVEGAMREQLNNRTLKLDHDVDVDPLQGIQVPVVMSDERVDQIPIENRGAGVQNSFILALFRTYAKYETPNFILAIEEPENSLHPRAQREMRWAMQDLSRTSQVICTTHSPVFLDLGRLEDNVVLRRKSDGATEPSYFSLQGVEEINELRELIGIKVSDALLSGGGNCTLIVEGDTELYAYPHLFACLDMNPRSLGVSIISAGGSDVKKMVMHAKILKAYNLPCIIVLDKGKEAEAAEIERRKLSNVKSVFVLRKGNFEEYLPREIMIEVINELCQSDIAERESSDVVPISKFDIDTSKSIENQLKKLVHEKYVGVRFEYLKVRLGEEVGKRMVERRVKPDSEIAQILCYTKNIALA